MIAQVGGLLYHATKQLSIPLNKLPYSLLFLTCFSTECWKRRSDKSNIQCPSFFYSPKEHKCENILLKIAVACQYCPNILDYILLIQASNQICLKYVENEFAMHTLNICVLYNFLSVLCFFINNFLKKQMVIKKEFRIRLH